MNENINNATIVSLTQSQLGIYFYCVNHPESITYNIPFRSIISKEKNISASKLIESVNKVLASHDIFGCSIDMIDGEPSMIKNQYSPTCTYQKVSTFTEEDMRKMIKPFDFKNEPLIKSYVFETDDEIILFFHIHHIIFDGASTTIFFQEISDCYNGQNIEKEDFTIFDLSELEKKNVGSEEYKQAEEFFDSILNTAECANNFEPNVFDCPQIKTGFKTVRLDGKCSPAEVGKFTKETSITGNTFFLSAYQYTLSLFNGSKKSMIYMSESGRKKLTSKRSIGMLVKTIPQYADFSDNLNVKTFLQDNHKRIQSSMNYNIYPLSQLTAKYGLDVDFIYTYQVYQHTQLNLNGTSFPLLHENFEAISKISLEVLKQEDHYILEFMYRRDLYDEELMESFIQTFLQVISELLQKSNFNDIQVVSTEQAKKLDDFNATEFPYEKSDLITKYKKNLDSYLDKPAVVYCDKVISYREMERTSDAIASYILDKNIGKNDVVSVLIPRCEYMMIATLGVTKSGAAYQPLDTSYPKERISFMIEDASAKLLITSRELLDLAGDYHGDVLFIEDFQNLPYKGEVKTSIDPDNLFVLLYTSGTTGTPKGVMLEHQNVVAYCIEHQENMKIDDSSKIASYASYGFDAYMMDYVIALYTHATVYIIPEDIRLDFVALENFYHTNGITHGFMTTQVGRQFIEFTQCPTLTAFVVGGEALVPLEKVNPKVRLINAYGPSECTIYVTSFVVDKYYKRVPIGKPNKNTKIYVVDDHLRRLPVGMPGELVVAGHQVGRGYLNRPEKSAQAFIKNPFDDAIDYNRVYRTGDVVRILPDGNVDFMGRNDGQVKVRGFRIELTEVEAVIRNFEGIKDVTVQAFEKQGGGKFIAAYLVSDQKINIDELNRFIAEQKPPYMVPAVSMQIDAIPLNVNGKVDKRKLPTPELNFQSVKAPQTELQKKIFDKVAEVIGFNNFGINTDIFEAGLTSIGSLKLNMVLSKEFTIIMKLRDLKDNNTVEKLEKFVLSATKGTQTTVQEKFPLTKTQEGIFVECMSATNPTVYNIPFLLQLDDSIDINRLKKAIVKVLNSHKFMNTTLTYDQNGIPNLLKHDEPVDESYIDVVTAASMEELKPTLIQPFNLIGGTLYRVKLIFAEKHYLFIDIHHIISDGTSMNILVSDISKAYSNENVESENFSGFDISLEEQQNRTPSNIQQSKNYYDKLLSGLDTDFLLKTDVYQNSPLSSGSFKYKVNSSTTTSVLNYAEKNKLSLNGLMCSVFGFVLAKYNASPYSIFTTVYNGRDDYRTLNTVSMLVKTLPVVCNIEDKSPKQLCSQIAYQLLDNMANDTFSFAEINKEFGVQANVMFIYQGDNFTFDNFCGKESKTIEFATSDEKEPMSIQVFLQKGQFVCNVDYDNHRFSEKLMRSFILSFEKALSEFIAKDSLDSISIMSDEDLKVLDGYNQTQLPYDTTKTIIDYFDENVKQYPDKVAVSYHDAKYTYRELNQIAINLASYLRDAGVKNDDFVSILTSRNEYMCLAPLGVLKAGAAYQPLDSSYPKERLNFMVKDCGAKVVIMERSFAHLLDDYQGKVLYIDEILSLPKVNEFKTKVSAQNAFAILYTSGTTGVPKGCVLEHQNMVCLFQTNLSVLHLDENTQTASYASFGFDACVCDTLSTLMIGGCVHIIPDDVRLNMDQLEDFFIKNSITLSLITTQVGRMLAQQTKCKTLKALMVGGEALVPLTPPSYINLINGYGPSEAMTYISSYVVKSDDPLLPIGKINQNSKAYIIDKFGNRLPFGACGELCISGRQLGRGYLNRPEKTAESFVKNPFCSEVGYERMYKTGDVTRMLTDGNIEFIGRRDGQIKVRGFRIELSEVESIIRQFPSIKDATVQSCDNPSGGKMVVAYIVSDQTVDIAKLNAFIGEKKPSYMIPAITMQIDKIPLTVNSKVDKRKLPKPQQVSTKVGAEPANETERKICAIFKEVIGSDKVYADDNFFEIGGTSISAVQVVVKCGHENMPIVFKNLFDKPTAQQLAKFLLEGDQKEYNAPAGDEKNSFDYSSLNYNVVEHVSDIKLGKLGNVLLTGVTGFLGSHVFRELIDNTDSHITCIVRDKDGLPSQVRVGMMMTFYFEDWFEKVEASRYDVINCDISDKDILEKVKDCQFDCIINCAANVKHFDQENSMMSANVSGVENLIEIAEKTGAKLIQTSTISVSGESVNGSIPSDFIFKENHLNIGQSLENKYVRSKYLAEQAIIDAISKGKIIGKIMRLGNLMARNADGEFQINSSNNGFLKQFVGYVHLGCYPVDMMDAELEFSPIDCVARAIVLLSTTPDCFTVFHARNCHTVHFGYFVNALKEIGYKIDIVEQNEFEERFKKALEDDSKNVSAFTGFIAYLNKAKTDSSDIGKEQKYETRSMIQVDTKFTTKALYRLGFAWPLIDMKYLEQMIEKLSELDFFTK